MQFKLFRGRFTAIKWIVLIGFMVLNIVAYNHAYKFTHFSKIDGKKIPAEDLPFTTKLKVLFTGIDNPRPQNNIEPKRSFETIKIQSDQLLEGWLIKINNSKGLVILFHGYSGSKSGNITYAEAFNQLGYSTLLIDFMGSGGSTGNQTTIGFKESQDVQASFEYANKAFPNNEIILFGTSMGAVSIMKAIADYDIQPNKIILECPFGTMRKTVQKRFEAMGIPSFPFADMLMFYGGFQNDFNAYKHNPSEYAKAINIPTLLMSGAKDKRVTLAEIDTIYDNLSGQKNKLIFKNSGHENYLTNNRIEWINAIQHFISTKK